VGLLRLTGEAKGTTDAPEASSFIRRQAKSCDPLGVFRGTGLSQVSAGPGRSFTWSKPSLPGERCLFQAKGLLTSPSDAEQKYQSEFITVEFLVSLWRALANFARSIIFWATASRIGLTVASVRWSVTSHAKGKQQDAESQIDGSRGP
jgi:hypothetical protein